MGLKISWSGVLWLGAALAAVAAVWIWFKPSFGFQSDVNPRGPQQRMTVGEAELQVEVRDTEASRGLGLSFRESLGENEGMLFVFPEATEPFVPTFWMKDMKFALDMIWIGEDGVVDIDERVPSPSKENPKVETVTPDEPVIMVLEVPAGWVEKNGVEVGDQVTLGE